MAVDLAVIGLGYVGLQLAEAAARAGMSVVGIDTSAEVVSGLNNGVSHVDDLSDGDIAKMLAAGFRATTDASELAHADTVVICAPTPLSDHGGPDLSAVTAAAGDVADHLRPRRLVILESTTYPGTTDTAVRPILERSGLVAGEDFHLAYSPERIDPGNRDFRIPNTPKIVGGLTPGCTRRAVDFYRRFVDTVVTTRGTREAETAKLLENTYRHVNIALVNELARFCHELGIDLWDAVRAAATKPFGFQPFYPGPGVGGHCIPVDPNYLSYSVRAELGCPFRLVEMAQEINTAMPAYVARRAQDILNDDGKAVRGSTVLLLGVTYKPDISDQRESPAVPLAGALMNMGATVTYHDPYVTRWRVHDRDIPRRDALRPAVAEADLVILVQNHRTYDAEALARSARQFLDTRGVTTGPYAHRL